MLPSWEAALHELSSSTSATNESSLVEVVSHLSWNELPYIVFSIGMVFGPHIGYVVQLYEMSSTRNVEGYSPLVSLILLVSNEIRIVYFAGHHFALALLFQAIFAILVHSLLIVMVLHLTHSVPSYPGSGEPRNEGLENEIATARPPPADAASPANREETVLAETSSRSILARLDDQACRLEQALLAYSAAAFLLRCALWTLILCIAALFYYAAVGPVWDAAPEVIGYIALGIEALLVLPQILHNDRRQSTQGLTMVLVLTWFLGDIIKLIYFICDHQPLPFILCGGFQLSLDLVVIWQVIYFRLRRRPLRVDPTPTNYLSQTEVVDSTEFPLAACNVYRKPR
ncbi:uncharacterized protein Tco025E_02402 [Trypanosoma conorhini]|uniref:Uncharacterized protein n=1 Tax=Trypanosoma conorhini TaxID=83891 RepID=A0A422Q4N2_9TRYP|nr:uncharacterized protein Tco025E_02402 [Trypanosoma conorhini]RNF24926.1 hypothetical protein Tco025E_02402 [Trypanosoma conorhini]